MIRDIEDLAIESKKETSKTGLLCEDSKSCAKSENKPIRYFGEIPGLNTLLQAPSNPLYKKQDIQSVHLEITDKCNAACPQCMRNLEGGAVNPLLPLTELSLEQIKVMFPVEFIKQIKKLYFCGNYGDPIQAKDLLDVVRYFRKNNIALQIGVHTNGGARTEAYWSALGSILQSPTGYVRFAIDGLDNTNHLYRQNVVWSSLMANVRAFIQAGGNAEWDFIVFRHNEHQVEKARALSKKLGFKKFQAKATARFMDKQDNAQESHLKTATPVRNTHGEVVRHLQLPKAKQWQNKALVKDLNSIIQRYGSLYQYYDQCTINCKVQKKREIYISAEGYVFPCCWLHGQLYTNDLPDSKRHAANLIRAAHPDEGLQAVSLMHHSLEEVLDSPFYTKLLAASWGTSFENGRSKMCAQVCGTELDTFKSQFNTKSNPHQELWTKMASAAETFVRFFNPFPNSKDNVDKDFSKDKDLTTETKYRHSVAIQNLTVVFYGTVTGTAESLALYLKILFGSDLFLFRLSEFSSTMLQHVIDCKGIAVFVLATTGQGDWTEDATTFIEYLQHTNNNELCGLRFALFGLGSSIYTKYNNAGKQTALLLKAAGAVSVCSEGWGDSYCGQMQNQFHNWALSSLLFALTSLEENYNGGKLQFELPVNSSNVNELFHFERTRAKWLTVISNVELRQRIDQGSTKELVLKCPPDFRYSTGDTIGVFVGNCQDAQPRYYTAASSSVSNPYQLALVVTKVSQGLCSEWMCELNPGEQLLCFCMPSSFQLRTNGCLERPLLMVATGSGIAPFMGFLEELHHMHQSIECKGHTNNCNLQTTLLFGCKNETLDFIYKSKLDFYKQCGVLTTLLVAFSAEERLDAKYYVQDLIKDEQQRLVQTLVNSDTHVYVCGKAAMGVGVREAFRQILDENDFTTLVDSNRFHEELWG